MKASIYIVGAFIKVYKLIKIMAHLIDKDVLATEIEGRLNSFDPNEITSGRYELVKIRDFLNTLEVKEVDLEKEFDNYTKNILACDIQFEPFTQLYKCAKHFFELGLKCREENKL